MVVRVSWVAKKAGNPLSIALRGDDGVHMSRATVLGLICVRHKQLAHRRHSSTGNAMFVGTSISAGRQDSAIGTGAGVASVPVR